MVSTTHTCNPTLQLDEVSSPNDSHLADVQAVKIALYVGFAEARGGYHMVLFIVIKKNYGFDDELYGVQAQLRLVRVRWFLA